MRRLMCILVLVSSPVVAQVSCQTTSGITQCRNAGNPEQSLVCQSSYGVTRCNVAGKPQQPLNCQTANGITRCSGPVPQPSGVEPYRRSQPSQSQSGGTQHVDLSSIGLDGIEQSDKTSLNQALLRNANIASLPFTNVRRLPSDIELKAAYCLAVLGAQQADYVQTVEMIKRFVEEDRGKNTDTSMQELLTGTEEEVKEQKQRIDRLYGYIAPRRQYLDSSALLSALSQGEVDWARQKQSPVGENCKLQCRVNVPASESWIADAVRDANIGDKDLCLTRCMEKDPLSRHIFECQSLSFLPY